MEINPPIANEKLHVTEIHGKKIIDNYFWLRNKENPDVIDYLNAENEYTDKMTAHTKELQNTLFEEMKLRIKEDDSSVPMKDGDYYYYSRDEKGKNYKIYCRKHLSIENDEEILLDLNILAEGRDYLRMGFLDWSHDHGQISYTLDFNGSEKFKLYVKNLSTGEVMDTQLTNLGGIARFNYDGTKIYYFLRDETNRVSKLKIHQIESNIDSDLLLLDEEDIQYSLASYPSTDRKYLFIVSNLRETDKLYFIDLINSENQIKKFQEEELDVEYQLDHHDGYFYVLTSHNALNEKIIRTKVDNLNKDAWEEIKPHNEEVLLLSIKVLKNHLAVFSLENGSPQIDILSINTNSWHRINFDHEIYDVFLHSRYQNYDFENNFLRVYYSSPITPLTVYDYDLTKKELILKKVDEVKNFSTDNYITRREYATARDGEKIPLSISMKKGLKQDSENPLVLTGYGSYGSIYATGFNSNVISLLDRGVIVVIAHIRGGSEKGKLWYHNGRMFKKKNTFFDFIDSAKYLINNNYTNSAKLAISGGSAGGLLVGACINYDPNLFKAALARVPFVDVIQTMLDETIPLTTSEYGEWGDPKIKEEFDYMSSYSPYDQVKAMDYPNLLITAGLNDPRVAYWEPAKWIAKLRQMKTDKNSLILKTNMGAGHGGASGRYENLKERAFEYAFLLDQFGLL